MIARTLGPPLSAPRAYALMVLLMVAGLMKLGLVVIG